VKDVDLRWPKAKRRGRVEVVPSLDESFLGKLYWVLQLTARKRGLVLSFLATCIARMVCSKHVSRPVRVALVVRAHHGTSDPMVAEKRADT